MEHFHMLLLKLKFYIRNFNFIGIVTLALRTILLQQNVYLLPQQTDLFLNVS